LPKTPPLCAEGAIMLERTIIQLDTGPMPPDMARQIGQLGYMQWIAALPGEADYLRAAQQAYDTAAPFKSRSPAVAEFCALLRTSLDTPLTPLALAMPARQRRGGANARRSSRLPL
jgi:hypothetical protein